MAGPVTGDEGAGQQYFTLPVGLNVQNTDGSTQSFVACYVLHLGSPSAQGTLPFESLGIQKGQARQLSSGENISSQLGSYCNSAGFPTGHDLAPQPNYAPDDISASRYQDDRSGAAQVIRSYYNAVNRSEYVRAYSYWEPAAASQQLASLDAFSKGYADTQSVKLTTGKETSSSGAGQVYQTVPVTLVAQTRSGQTQTFVGCYTLHLSNPQIQGVPPFQPMGITNAKLQKVENNANTGNLMASACQ